MCIVTEMICNACFLGRALENLINAWLGGQRKKDGRRDASAACGHSTARLLAKFRHLSAGGRSVRLDPAIPVGELAKFQWLRSKETVRSVWSSRWNAGESAL